MKTLKIIEILPDGSLNIDYKNFYGIDCFKLQEENYMNGFLLQDTKPKQNNMLSSTDEIKIEKSHKINL
jgi:hypothetical protein